MDYVDGPVTMTRVRVSRKAEPAKEVSNPVPGGPVVVDAQGEAVGGLLLWLDSEGYIDALEYWWVSDDILTELPDPTQVRGR